MITTAEVSYLKVNQAFSYEGYKKLTAELAEQNKASGDEAMLQKLKMNLQRISRNEKKVIPGEEIILKLHSLKTTYEWVVIAEPWCGDGAQSIPVMNKLALASDGRIDLRIILRDENPAVMDQFLTDGKRSIPILICIDKASSRILWTWGPRTKAMQARVSDLKASDPGILHDELVYNIQKWYAEDNGTEILRELGALIQKLS